MFRSTLLALLALGTLACQQSPVAPGGRLPLTLTAKVSTTTLVVGQPDTITVTLANTAPASITLHFGSSCQIMPYVANATGAVVLPAGGGWMCLQMLSQLTLAPFATQRVQFVWSGGTGLASQGPTPPLPLGPYVVYATLSAREGTLTTRQLPVELQ